MVVVLVVAYALLITLLVLAVVCLLKGKWKLLLVAIVVWMLASLSIANQRAERDEKVTDPSILPELLAIAIVGGGAVNPPKAKSWWARHRPRSLEVETGAE